MRQIYTYMRNAFLPNCIYYVYLGVFVCEYVLILTFNAYRLSSRVLRRIAHLHR